MRKLPATTLALIGLAAGLAGCQALPDARPPASSTADTQGSASEGATPSKAPVAALSFAQAACGDCHAVETPGLSPNPASPTFEEIVNRPGLTKETLSTFLTDAHNYPEVMDFDLDAPRIASLVDYMMTLQAADDQPSE